MTDQGTRGVATPGNKKLTAKVSALTARVDAQATEISRLKLGAGRTGPAVAPAISLDQKMKRRGVVKTLVGATVAAVVLTVSRQAGTAEAGANVTVTGASGNWGVLAQPGVAAPPSPTNLPNSGVGVIGTSFAGFSPAFPTDAAGAGAGIWGAAAGGIGVLGISTDGTGVFGESITNRGAYGQSVNSDGVHGHSTNGCGLRGTSSAFVGLIGASNGNIGLYGYTTAPNTAAFYAENLAASGQRVAGFFYGDVQVLGNFSVTGAKNAAVTMPDGSEAVLYCQESPEPYFEDFGRGRLVNGVAHIALESEFASLVKRDDYMVFITPGGETKSPLYVGPQNANDFEVREANAGTSSIPFTYRIVAKRKDIEGKRLARLDPKLKQNIERMRAETAQKSRGRPQGIAAGVGPLVPLDPFDPPTTAPDGKR